MASDAENVSSIWWRHHEPPPQLLGAYELIALGILTYRGRPPLLWCHLGIIRAGDERPTGWIRWWIRGMTRLLYIVTLWCGTPDMIDTRVCPITCTCCVVLFILLRLSWLWLMWITYLYGSGVLHWHWGSDYPSGSEITLKDMGKNRPVLNYKYDKMRTV